MNATDEREAMEWLEARVDGERMSAYAPATTIKSMLARPVLPREPSAAALKAMYDSYAGACMCGGDPIKGAYRALYAHLTAPRTKEETFTRWLVVAPHGEYGPYAVHSDAVGVSIVKRGTVVELTGKAMVPV
jgi:hypothetical protein